MDHGKLSNPEILLLIGSGKVSYQDIVYSTDWKEKLYFDGIVFISFCTCQEVGTRSSCTPANAVCLGPKSLRAEFV